MNLPASMMCQAMSALLSTKQRGDPGGWRVFQERAHALKNRRTRARREAEDLETSLFAAQTALRLQDEGALGKETGFLPYSNVRWHPGLQLSPGMGSSCCPHQG